jgi:hypothetical protein
VARALAARYSLVLINPDDLLAKAVAAAEQDQQGELALSIRLIKDFSFSKPRNCTRNVRSVGRYAGCKTRSEPWQKYIVAN